jgi:hypothetical protein
MKTLVFAAAATAVVIAALTGCSAAASDKPAAKPVETSASSTPEAPAVPLTTAEWAATFPIFDRQTFTGSGPSEVELPAGATAGALTFAADLGGSFPVVYVSDSEHSVTGAYGEGTSVTLAYGVKEEPTKLSHIVVETDGAWTLDVYPVKDLPEMPTSGANTAAYLYSGPAAAYRMTLEAGATDLHFTVEQVTGEGLINWNDNTVSPNALNAAAVPSIVTVYAHAGWQLTSI